MRKIWNGKLCGLFGASIIGLTAAFNRIVERLSTFLFVNNIASCGKNVRVMRGVFYREPTMIECGNNVTIGTRTSLSTESIGEHRLKIENGASIGNYCQIDFSGGIRIGEYTHIAHDVLIFTHDHGYDHLSKPVGKYLEIDDHAFVGSKSIILFNCNRIGKNAVIGAGSVVTKDVPDYAIVAGNPATIIKYSR